MEYLIKNTTREQRKKIAKDALAIAIGSNSSPSEYAISLVKEYIEGNIELKEVQRKIVERYKKV